MVWQLAISRGASRERAVVVPTSNMNAQRKGWLIFLFSMTKLEERG